MICIILCFANVICYADRTNISVAILAMAAEPDLDWDEEVQGQVLSSFFYGYLATQVVGGLWARRIGGQRVLNLAVFVWSLFTALTPLATRSSFGALIACRILMGLGEGLALPAIHAMLGVWFPKSERTRAVTFTTSGQVIGTVLALASSPFVAQSWPSVFHAFGLAGFIWVLFAARYGGGSPASHSTISRAERIYIETGLGGGSVGGGGGGGFGDGGASRFDNGDLMASGSDSDGSGDAGSSMGGISSVIRQGDSLGTNSSSSRSGSLSDGTGFGLDGVVATEPLPSLPRLLLCRPFLAIIVGHTAHNYGWYVLLSWMPKYLTELGLSIDSVGFYALLPYLGMFVLDNVWGWVVDGWIAGGMRVVTARKLSQGIAFLGPALALSVIVITGTTSLIVNLALLTIGVSCTACIHAGIWANIIDISPRHAGYLLGVSNTFASLPGIFGNVLTGHILQQTKSWAAVFGVAIAVYMVGLVVYLKFASASVLFR